MRRLMLVELDDSQNGSVYEHFINRLPVGSTVVFDEINLVDSQQDRYTFWFDGDSTNWQIPQFEEYNWMFLKQQQNWANDMLRARGHVFLNEILGMLGMPVTSFGQLVGWINDKDNQTLIDFGCWDSDRSLVTKEDGSIKLTFNVPGSICQML